MPAPTSPKKRALMASTKLRKTLRGAGHHLSPFVQVGKEGVTDAVLRQLDEQLAVHELVKVKVGTESPEDRFEAAERLGEAAGAQIAQVLGRTVLVYRKHPDKPRFEPMTAAEKRDRDLSLAAERAAEERSASRRSRRGRSARGGAARGGRGGGAREGARGGRDGGRGGRGGETKRTGAAGSRGRGAAVGGRGGAGGRGGTGGRGGAGGRGATAGRGGAGGGGSRTGGRSRPQR